MAFGRVGIIVTGRIGIPVHIPTEGTGELSIAPVEGFHAETEGKLLRDWTWQWCDAGNDIGNQWFVDKHMD
ncbi:hypothetical protein D9M71_686120 [compost metagenome]